MAARSCGAVTAKAAAAMGFEVRPLPVVFYPGVKTWQIVAPSRNAARAAWRKSFDAVYVRGDESVKGCRCCWARRVTPLVEV